MLVAKEVIGKGIEAAGTLLGQGDMFGINSFSTKMATERKYTTGLGVTTYGRTRAFQNVFGRVADAGSMLESSVQARTDPTSPAFQSYLMAGVNPYGGEPGDVGKQYLGRIREMARAFCHWIRASFFSSRKSYRL